MSALSHVKDLKTEGKPIGMLKIIGPQRQILQSSFKIIQFSDFTVLKWKFPITLI